MKASSFCTNIRMKQRIIFLSFLFIFLFLYAIKISNVNSKAASYYHLNSLKSEEECILEQRQQQEKLFFLDDTNNNNNDKKRRAVKYLDLNEEQQQQQHILLLTTLTTLNDNIDTYLTNYFDLIDQSTYPNKLITLSFLLTQQKDAESLESLLKAKVQQYQYGRWNNQFFQINIVQKDFTDMSRAKNFLLSTSLREYHSWVFWLDFNQLYSFPKTIFHDLISLDEDVIVPNCLLLSQDSYDSTSNWQESDLSLLKQQNIPENQILTLGKKKKKKMPFTCIFCLLISK